MPLKTVVKVGNISNLSDARYCAGMGVDMLGFQVIEGEENYISPKLFQEIRGWVSGPKVVAEIYGIASADELPGIIENYAPDYFELSESEFARFKDQLALPCIVNTNRTIDDKQIAFALTDENNVDSVEHALIKASSAKTIPDLLSHPAVAGIALSGSAEVRPGFKDYGDLSEILEALDAD